MALGFVDLLLQRLIRLQISGDGAQHLLGMVSELRGIQRLAERGQGAREIGPLAHNSFDVFEDEA
ncbi:hypothetical protein PSYJA_33515 [Pseudomonas syringae pv. japonica str. M301072]|uniref:Uncharacterized protein n=1 Tax=Pseudomonas syringae pv. japonica str. M301072 TaxID=629262 RepID=F3FTN0_PSESX|nr:hypothetical protein PSYJA_33515 [Pseudomonas syringae pv. japonica str. M301072]